MNEKDRKDFLEAARRYLFGSEYAITLGCRC